MPCRIIGLCLLFLIIGAMPACAGPGREASGMPRQTLHIGGVERGYYLHVPEHVARTGRRVPLVISLHGGGGNGRIQAMMTGFTAKAEREGFIVVYPDGSGGLGDKLLTWNAGHCCAYAMKNKTDDIGFIRALLDKLLAELSIDPARVYATGLSNGGMMAHRLGIAMPDRIAAVAPVISSLFGDEPRPSMPVPALIINGALDQAVPVQGGALGTKRIADAADAPLKPVAYQGAFWAAANGCGGAPLEEKLGAQVIRWRYSCPEGRGVIRYLVLDNGHAWPGGQPGRRRADQPSASLNATDIIWDFFKNQRR